MRWRLGEADREQHERGDEWVDMDYALSGMDDASWDELDAVEQEIGPLLNLRRESVRGLRLMMWSSRRKAGIREPFADFKPRPFHFEYDRKSDGEAAQAADADPPDGSGSSAASASATRSSTPTRRSRASSGSARGKSGS